MHPPKAPSERADSPCQKGAFREYVPPRLPPRGGRLPLSRGAQSPAPFGGTPFQKGAFGGASLQGPLLEGRLPLSGGRFPLSGGNGRRPKGVGRCRAATEGVGTLSPKATGGEYRSPHRPVHRTPSAPSGHLPRQGGGFLGPLMERGLPTKGSGITGKGRGFPGKTHAVWEKSDCIFGKKGV